MQLFYTPEITKMLELPKDESRHLVQVLRKEIGEEVHFTDGKGTLALYKIWQNHPKRAVLELKNKDYKEKPQPELTLAIAPTKNMDRIEWFLEKATEIGVSKVVLFVSDHSERRKVRMVRLDKILIASMKQSQQSWKPELEDLQDFESMIKSSNDVEYKFICHQSKGVENHLFKAMSDGKNAFVLVGPEGDFSDDELKKAEDSGFQFVSLGPNRLRTETAGVAVCQIFAVKNF